MKLLQCVLVTITLCAAQSVLAARPNYTYVGLGWAYDHLDGGCNQDGPFVEGSVVMNELFYVRLQHTDVTSSSWCGSTTTALGGGAYFDIGATSSLYANVSLVRRDYGDTEMGFGIDGGFRSILDSGTEVIGFIGYEDIDIVETTYFGAGANYWLSQSFSVNGSLTLNDDNNEGIKVGLRYNF